MSATAELDAPQTLQFKTELKQLLDLIIHSLYTKKEIFLRELISNAADAIDKLRFEGLTNPSMLDEGTDWKIRLIPDEKANTLTIRDNGIGMSREQIVENLGTIARSGTKAFLQNLQKAEAKDRPELIGQFGVGFYASFMVADRVTVISKPAGGGDAVKWESDGQGEFSVSPADRPEGRGTDVILHLRDDAKEFTSSWSLQSIVKKYSDFIEHPVVVARVSEKDGKTETTDETLNSRQAIWLRPKSEVKSPEVIPPYLRFIKGVVDCADLPLNVSRETLQHNPVLAKVKSNVANRVLKTLEEMKSSDADAYRKFYEAFGVYLKEGIASEWSSKDKERLADLLLVESTATKPGEYTSLEKYVAAMKSDQKEIHYLIGESRQMLDNSPYLESFKARGEEVLLLTDPVDEYFLERFTTYKDKPLKAADRGEVKTEETDEQKKQAESLKPVLSAVKEKLGGAVADVRFTRRLKESAAVLVAEEGAPSPQMERLMAKMGRDVTPTKRVLELNPDHPVVAKLKALHEANATDAKVESIGRLLYDQALIAEGSKIEDPAGFARRVNDLIAAM